MINTAIIEAVIKQSNPENKDAMLNAFIVNFVNTYKYNDDNVNHCLEILLGKTNPIDTNDIDMDYVKKNINKYIYKSEHYIIKDVELKSVDNIEGIICVDYKAKEDIDKDDDNISFNRCSINISFIDYPQVLKKS